MASTLTLNDRSYTVTTADDTNTLIIGPGATSSRVGTKMVQFTASGFTGSFTVKGRMQGSTQAALAIPYRKVNIGSSASDYTVASAAITATGIIQIPANGMEISLLMACSAGTCVIDTWDLDGPSAV